MPFMVQSGGVCGCVLFHFINVIMTRLLFICLGMTLLLPTVLPPAAFAQALPPASEKVVRYAGIVIQRLDQNGDGVLQREEWKNMPGTPQAIDRDGDGQITRDELIWYLRHYGQTRTIHRTIVLDLSEPYRFDPANMRLFTRPVWQRAAALPVVSEEGIPETTEDATEALIAANEEAVDDDIYQKMLEERQIPSSRPYHVLPEDLRGVPRWFLLLDKNGDGQVSLAEFAPTLSPASVALFNRLNKNGDYFITPDKVRTAQEQ